MKNDCILIAKKTKFLLNGTKNFQSILCISWGYLIIDENKKNKFIDTSFDTYWRDNIDISKEENIQKILENCEINKNSFEKDINNQKTKDELKKLTNEAFDNNIFGAPTFVINNKLFWGQDRLDYALDELDN